MLISPLYLWMCGLVDIKTYLYIFDFGFKNGLLFSFIKSKLIIIIINFAKY